MRIRYKKKRRKTRKLYGQKYRGYGQVGRHRNNPGGRGRAGSKDHIKIQLNKMGYEFGSRGFVSHGLRRGYLEVNLDRLLDFARREKVGIGRENEKMVIDLRSYKYVKILGKGKVLQPIKIILNRTAKISETARKKILNAGGEIILAE